MSQISTPKQKFLAKLSKMVDPSLCSINQGAIDAVSIDKLPDIGIEEALPPEIKSPRDALRLVLCINSINHQFWDLKGGEFERYTHKGLTGAMAMQRSMADWLGEAGSMDGLARGLPVTEEEVKRVFGPIPDPGERAKILTQALGPQGQQAADELLAMAPGGWGIPAATVISALLPLGYEDPMLKKSQLMLHMGQSALKAYGMKVDCSLTCFADYQVPKVLRGMGVLSYGPELAQAVDGGALIPQDSKMEVALRAATVLACESLSEKLGLSAASLDFYLWSRRNEFKQPFHLTKTARY